MKTALALAVLVACAPSRSALRAPVDALVAKRLALASGKVPELLARPIDRAAAIKIAIANNARLAATFDELGIAGGELASAIGLGPLEIEAQARFGDAHDAYEIDVVQGVMGLVSAPRRRAAAHASLDAARASAAAQAVRLAARVDIAFTDLLAAMRALEMRRTAFEAADASATLRERMFDAGNTSVLEQARERADREQARIDLARAEATLELRRTTIDALLGLSGETTRWTATGTLAALPPVAPALDALEATAVEASLDLTADRARRDAAENRVADLRLRTVLPSVGIGISVHDDGEGRGIGPMISLGIPLLDWKSGERASAHAAIDHATHTLTATAVELRANARGARITALAAYQEAVHVERVVLPLRQQILDETLKHYNAMNLDTFALLMARRDLVAAEDQHLDAVRRFWNAMAAVDALRRGVAVEMSTDAAPAAAPSTAPTSEH